MLHAEPAVVLRRPVEIGIPQFGLVFGPMVDIKSTLLYAGIFKRKVVAYIVVLPLLMTILAAVFINLNTTW